MMTINISSKCKYASYDYRLKCMVNATTSIGLKHHLENGHRCRSLAWYSDIILGTKQNAVIKQVYAYKNTYFDIFSLIKDLSAFCPLVVGRRHNESREMNGWHDSIFWEHQNCYVSHRYAEMKTCNIMNILTTQTNSPQCITFWNFCVCILQMFSVFSVNVLLLHRSAGKIQVSKFRLFVMFWLLVDFKFLFFS